MHNKSNITYLMNPAIQTKTSIKGCHTPDRKGDSNVNSAMMSLSRSLSPVSPKLTISSLLYRRQLLTCIVRCKKRSDHLGDLNSKKISLSRLPLMTLATLSSAPSSNSDSNNSTSSSNDNASTQTTARSTSTATTTTQSGKMRIRKTHTPPCQVEGCKNLAVSRGCCVRHGGGSRCMEPGCTKRAKLYQRCFQHGGFKMRSESGCVNKAKRYGRCWSHGGGHARRHLLDAWWRQPL